MTPSFAAALALALARPSQFPAVKAYNLNGGEMELPRGFAGARNLVLIAFQREQQADLDTWLKPLPAIAAAHPDFQYYECPTIQKPMKLVQMFINQGMRGGIPDKGQRARTITLYLEKEPFKAALGIQSEKTVYELLVDRAGAILWREEGRYTEAKGLSLEEALKKPI
jgi:hypothetical protein